MSPEDITRPRPETAVIKGWIPIIVPVLAVGIAWGEQRMARQSDRDRIDLLTATSSNLADETRRLSDQAIRWEAQVEKLSSQLAEARVSAAIVANLAKDVGDLQASHRRSVQNFTQLWDLVRRNEGAVREMQRDIEKFERR